MNDREYAKTKARVDRYFRQWVTALGLGFWHIKVTYEREKHQRDNPEHTCVGTSDCSWKYLECNVTFYMPALLEKTDDEIENVVVHELAHALVNEMRESDENLQHEERVVSGLTRALLWTKDWKNSTRRLVRVQ